MRSQLLPSNTRKEVLATARTTRALTLKNVQRPTGAPTAVMVAPHVVSRQTPSDTVGEIRSPGRKGKAPRDPRDERPRKSQRLDPRESRTQSGGSAISCLSIEELRPIRALTKKNLRADGAAIMKLIGTTPTPQVPTYDYNLDIVPNTQHAALAEYLTELDQYSRPAIRDDTLRHEIRRLWETPMGQVSKASILRPLAEGVAQGSFARRPDVQVVEDEAGLERALIDGFDLPIFIPAGSPLSDSTVKCRELTKEVLTVEQFFSDVLQNDEKTMDIQDTGVEKGTATAKKVKVGEIKDRYYRPYTRLSPWNGLEIGGATRGVKWPSVIERGNILNHLAYLPTDSVGRPTMSKVEYKRLDPWYLWTEKNSISRQHEDVAGLRTIILVIHGTKIWYLQPQRSRSDQRRWEKQSDKGPEGYTDGWARLILQKNDILIMRSREVHAVFTPEDTLCVGGHFTFHISEVIRGLHTQEENPELTNDEIPKHVFDILTDYLARVLDERLGYRYAVDAAELNAVMLELIEYVERKTLVPGGARQTEERAAHLKRKSKFLARVRREGWLERLRVVVGGLA